MDFRPLAPIVAAAALGSCAAFPQEQKRTAIAFVGGTLVDPASGMAQRADIVVVGDRVVVPHAAVPPSALRVDVRGKYLVPGLSGWARAF